MAPQFTRADGSLHVLSHDTASILTDEEAAEFEASGTLPDDDVLDERRQDEEKQQEIRSGKTAETSDEKSDAKPEPLELTAEEVAQYDAGTLDIPEPQILVRYANGEGGAVIVPPHEVDSVVIEGIQNQQIILPEGYVLTVADDGATGVIDKAPES